MDNAAIFEKVARREISPEDAAEAMLEADRAGRKRKRPSWAPKWAWASAVAIGVAVCAVFGIER